MVRRTMPPSVTADLVRSTRRIRVSKRRMHRMRQLFISELIRGDYRIAANNGQNNRADFIQCM
jgi:hypothetical protein